jgi:acetyltransferase-like isoleucine patch superfamily enzyme
MEIGMVSMRSALSRRRPAGHEGTSSVVQPTPRRRVVQSLTDVQSWLHTVRLLHFYSYAHVSQRRLMHLAADVAIAPNVSIRNGERITVGARTHLNEHSCIWAGDSTGRISIGADVLVAPGVFITASNYGLLPGQLIQTQPKSEADIVIGNDVWIGTGAVITAGVSIGDGCVVGANAVVTKDLPPGSIAGGVPARVLRQR